MRIDHQLTPLAQPTSVALGLFDGLHRGHQQVIEKSVHYCTENAEKKLLPAVFSFVFDDLTQITKIDFLHLLSPSMEISLLEQMNVGILVKPPFSTIKHLSADDFLEQILMNTLHAKAVFCGLDYRFGVRAEGNTAKLQQFCKRHEIYCEIIPTLMEGHSSISSTRIRSCIQKGQMEMAKKLLGYPYCIDFSVVHGKKLGRTLGFPTINQQYPERYALPQFGVYATKVLINGKEYAGVTNVGVKPTVGNQNPPSAETFIVGYEGNLYGQHIPISFVQFLREEQKFDSVEELKQQIQRDAEEVCHILSQK